MKRKIVFIGEFPDTLTPEGLERLKDDLAQNIGLMKITSGFGPNDRPMLAVLGLLNATKRFEVE